MEADKRSIVAQLEADKRRVRIAYEALGSGVLDYLDVRNLYKLRMISRDVTPLVNGTCFWDRLSKIQEKRSAIGKRVFLFTQYMMSVEDAQKLPPSTKYR